MNKIANIFMLISLLLLVGACSNDAPFTEQKGEGEGRFLTSALNVELKTDEKVVRSEGTPDVKDFTVDFVDIEQSAEPVKSFKYGEMPEVVTLPVGTYTVKAYYGGDYGEGKKAAFNAPYYLGLSEQFSIEKNKINDKIGTIVCKLSNVKVTILFDKSLAEAMSEDSSVSVNVGDSGSLEFTKTTEDSGYFAYVEGSTTISAVFTGELEGYPTNESKSYKDVQPGNHYRITFKLHAVDPNEPGDINAGDPGNEIKVDANIQLEDLTGGAGVDVGTPDDKDIFMTDDRYPDVNPGPGPDDPTPDDPNGPKITAEAPINLNTWNVNPSVCVLNVQSASGITGFEVDIVSNSLTPEELAGVGLAAHLDLIEGTDGAGVDLSAALTGLGFPIKENVQGQKDVKFDITKFIPLLGALGSGDHTFILKVTDESGTCEKELKIRIE